MVGRRGLTRDAVTDLASAGTSLMPSNASVKSRAEDRGAHHSKCIVFRLSLTSRTSSTMEIMSKMSANTNKVEIPVR